MQVFAPKPRPNRDGHQFAAAGTNTPAINKTNLPPGTIQNIDKMIQNTGTITQ